MWFNEKEFACKCCGQLPPEARENVRALVGNVLDPVRNLYGGAIRVNSGYRCSKHNAAVGGAAQSQHLLGQAADICSAVQGVQCIPEENLKIAQLIVMNGRWDQLILEDVPRSGLTPRWVHVSFRKDGRNRKKILKKIVGCRTYWPVSEDKVYEACTLRVNLDKLSATAVKGGAV